MQFDLVTPLKQLASMQADYVEIAGSEGEFGVLDGHQPTLSALRPGALTVRQGEEETTFCVGFGFVDVGAHSVTVLAEDAVNVAEIDAQAVKTALADAEKAVADADDATQKAQAEKRVAFLTAQLQLATQSTATADA